MMTDVFLKLLNMSIAASWVVLAVIVFRALFRKAPRWISLVMWGTVALRLVIPFSVESPLSMIPTTESFGTAGVSVADRFPHGDRSSEFRLGLCFRRIEFLRHFCVRGIYSLIRRARSNHRFV